MDPAIVARIQEWDTRPASTGYRGLHELAEAGFSGSLTTGTAWLFMLNGRIVGVADGALTSFESADVTAYEAPDPTLPLLYAMQEHGGEARAEYYTDDHPLSEVHTTLSDAGFTGYIELSDNVLSGDYYVVYYGGKSMSAAFVGNAEKLVTGDEAFRQAAEEVGIYQVIDVELDVRDVPEPTDQDEGAEEPSVGSASSEVGGAPEPSPDQSTEETAASESDESTDPQPDAEEASPAEPASPAPAEQPAGQSEPPEATSQQPAGEEREPAESRAPDDPFSQEAAWRETRTIPALDPDETDSPPTAEDGNGGQPPAEPAEVEATPEPTQEQTAEDDRLAELEAAVEAQSSTIAELESTLASTRAETKQLREERDALQAQLASNQEETETTGGTARGRESLDPETALDQTDLFVRYGSKGQPTLETAHDGQADRETVAENLRIDYHTRFEEDEVSVGGRPFEAFLTESLEYQFVSWLVGELLFEIQDTGSQRGLRDLFDVLPIVDRVEFYGTVTWRDPDAEETHTETFDVICRDRMGQALIVANLNDVRDPATGEMMEDLIEGASVIAGGVETLGAAFLVTSSFFQPDALETASEATGGGLLSREKRWSFVKLDRRHGYHLCLVEARGDEFHVAVPEL